MQYERKYPIYSVLFIAILGGLLRLALSFHMQVMNVDAIGYFASGVTLNSYFDGLSAFWSPFYPILCILVNYLVNNIELAGKIVSVIAGSCLVLIIYSFTRSLYGETTTILASIMTAFIPVMVYYSTFTTPEMSYLCLLYLSLLCFIKWVMQPTLRVGLANKFYF